MFGPLDSLFHYELLWCLAGGLAKGACKMKLAKVGDSSDLRKAQIVFQICDDIFLYTPDFIAREPAVRVFGCETNGRIISEKVQRQRLNQRIRKQLSCRIFRVSLGKQSEADVLDQRI